MPRSTGVGVGQKRSAVRHFVDAISRAASRAGPVKNVSLARMKILVGVVNETAGRRHRLHLPFCSAAIWAGGRYSYPDFATPHHAEEVQFSSGLGLGVVSAAVGQRIGDNNFGLMLVRADVEYNWKRDGFFVYPVRMQFIPLSSRDLRPDDLEYQESGVSALRILTDVHARQLRQRGVVNIAMNNALSGNNPQRIFDALGETVLGRRQRKVDDVPAMVM